MAKSKGNPAKDPKSECQTRVAISKKLPESPIISLSALTDSQTILIQFKKIDYINSTGIRNFSKWLRDLENTYPHLNIEFEAVPAIIARLLLTIRAYLPKNLKVLSMYVPFYCDVCGHENHDYLVQRAQVESRGDFDQALSRPVICQKCQKPMQPDVEPEIYLMLLLDRDQWTGAD